MFKAIKEKLWRTRHLVKMAREDLGLLKERVPGLESLPLVATTKVELLAGLVDGRGDMPCRWNEKSTDAKSTTRKRAKELTF